MILSVIFQQKLLNCFFVNLKLFNFQINVSFICSTRIIFNHVYLHKIISRFYLFINFGEVFNIRLYYLFIFYALIFSKYKVLFTIICLKAIL